METYNFNVVVEPDEDFDGNPSGWHAYCPVLEQHGASTWGATEAEALKNIKEAIELWLEVKKEAGEPIPVEEPQAIKNAALTVGVLV